MRPTGDGFQLIKISSVCTLLHTIINLNKLLTFFLRGCLCMRESKYCVWCWIDREGISTKHETLNFFTLFFNI